MHKNMRKPCYKARESEPFRTHIGILYKSALIDLYNLHKDIGSNDTFGQSRKIV